MRSNFVKGSVYYLFVPFTTPPKNKYIVLVGIEKTEARVLLINTDIHELIKKMTSMINEQIKIYVKQHVFLKHDSYVNCCTVFPMNAADLVRIRPQGVLHPTALKMVEKKIENSFTICKEDQDIISSW